MCIPLSAPRILLRISAYYEASSCDVRMSSKHWQYWQLPQSVQYYCQYLVWQCILDQGEIKDYCVPPYSQCQYNLLNEKKGWTLVQFLLPVLLYWLRGLQGLASVLTTHVRPIITPNHIAKTHQHAQAAPRKGMQNRRESGEREGDRRHNGRHPPQPLMS